MNNYIAATRPAPGAARDAFDAAEAALTPYQALLLAHMRSGKDWLQVRQYRFFGQKDLPNRLDAAIAVLVAGGLVTAV
ncbi:MAG TPA: hypothetical protein VGR26_12305 [Acidimicrobiales bacterium]|nr:hypothetical protein [Acidimicrobiales bacterium]